MPVAGIISEYNPFHRGHLYQVQELRRQLGADCGVVAVMSGNFVQRGEVSILEKHARAEAAVRCGVDLVVELPTVYAAATAEVFARGGVSLLAGCGVVTHLCFSSEAGDLEPLLQAADCLDSGAFAGQLSRFLGQGMSFAAARQAAAAQLLGDTAECLRAPNNNLGVEYLRALRRLGADLTPVTIRRVGAAHDSGDLSGFASASEIRRRVCSGEPWEDLVPPPVAEIFRREIAAGRGPVSMAGCERLVLGKLRAMDEAALAPYDGGGEGLYHRFYRAIRTAATLEEVFQLAKTKRYPHARLRRMALHAWLDLPAAPAVPPYIRVLAANGRGCALLREMKGRATLPVVMKSASALRLEPEAAECFAAESRCTGQYTLAWPRPGRPGVEYTWGPVLVDVGGSTEKEM